MQRNSRPATYETFAEVLKKRKWTLIIPAILLVLVIILSIVIRIARSNNEVFHSDVLPVMLNLNPIELESSTEDLGTVLTETAPVDDSYFADALFVGDSLCEGVRVYQDVFPGYRTATKIGLSIDALLFEAFMPLNPASDALKLSAIDHVSEMRPAKLYIMIGTNDLVWNDPPKMAESYGVFIDEVLKRLPSCKIVVVSIPPTTEATSTSRPNLSRERINAYNEELKKLAMAKGVYFLDGHSSLVGADGYLPVEIAFDDGIHLQPSGYIRWRDYLKSHAIQSDASYSIGEDGYIIFTQSTKPQETAPVDGEPTEDVPVEPDANAESGDAAA